MAGQPTLETFLQNGQDASSLQGGDVCKQKFIFQVQLTTILLQLQRQSAARPPLEPSNAEYCNIRCDVGQERRGATSTISLKARPVRSGGVWKKFPSLYCAVCSVCGYRALTLPPTLPFDSAL
jgi:hypothetical protein